MRISALALFARKKTQPPTEETPSKDQGTGEGNGTIPPDKPSTAAADQPEFSPEKAAKFFLHAKAAQDSTNYEFAMQLWLRGLRLDPHNMSALESFFQSAAAFLGSKACKKGLSKETQREFGGRGNIERYLAALLTWAMKPDDPFFAVRAAEAAAKANLPEPAYWLGERALAVVGREKKPRKDLFVKLMEAFKQIGAYDKAVIAGEAASHLDPTNGPLIATVRNLSALAAMSKGGYDQTGTAGGFRANVKDLESQRLIEEQERIVKTEETIDRLIAKAEQDFRAKPEDLPTVLNYAQRLLERGRPEDENRAYKVLMHTYEKTKQFRFRQRAGEIRLRVYRRQLLEYKQAAEANPNDLEAARVYEDKRRKYMEEEIKELQAQVEAYPTDLTLKFELGKRLLELGQNEEAIALFQESQKDLKNRVASMNYLGQAFMAIGWIDEAIETFRRVLTDYHKTHNDEVGMDVRYRLLTALQAKAERDRDVEAAEEADQIASSIAIQQISYRDIRARRDALKALIANLK